MTNKYTSYEWQTHQLLLFALHSLQNVRAEVMHEAFNFITHNRKPNDPQLFDSWQITNQLRYLSQYRDNPIVINFIRQNQNLQMTSYDYMVRGTTERSQFHPYTAISHFKRSIALNPLNYEVLIYTANAFSELQKEIESVKYLLCGKCLIERTVRSLPPMDDLPRLGASLLKPLYNKLFALRHLFIGKILSSRATNNSHIPTEEGLNRDEHYYKALEYDPKSVHAHFNLSYSEGRPIPIQDETNAHNRSIKHFKDALSCITVSTAPIYEALTYNNIGTTLLTMKKKKEALNYFASALQCNPRLGWTYFVRSQVNTIDEDDENEAEQLNLDQAISDLTFCIETLVPEQTSLIADLMTERARLKFRRDNNPRDFIQDLNRCLAVDPKNGYALLYRISAYIGHQYRNEDHDMSEDEFVVHLFDSAIAQSRGVDNLCLLLEKRYDYYRIVLNHNAALVKKSQHELDRFTMSFDRIQ